MRALSLVLRLSMHTVISDKKEELARLCRRFDVKKLEVFGSAARGVDFDPSSSDADFLVELDPNSDLPPFDRYFDLVEELRETLGRPSTWSKRERSEIHIYAPPSTSREYLSMQADPGILLTDIDQVTLGHL